MEDWTWGCALLLASIGGATLSSACGSEVAKTTTSGGGGDGTTPGTGGGPCADSSDCSQCESQASCLTCCDKADPLAKAKSTSLLLDACVCASPNMACSSVCMQNGQPPSLCADPPGLVSLACQDCVLGLASSEACVQSAAASCEADPKCLPLPQCRAGC